MITACAPGGVGDDHAAQIPALSPTTFAGVDSAVEGQQRWVDRFVASIVSKITVQVFLWNQLVDDQPHRLAHGGLFDTSEKPKPALESLSKIRQMHFV